MLYIEKQEPDRDVSAEISRVKRNHNWADIDKNDSQRVRDCFDDLDKTAIKLQLCREQHGICAYCMRRIAFDDNRMRIEHFVPIQVDGEKALSYNNLLGCCDGDAFSLGNAKRVLCCDAAKGNRKMFLNPLDRVQMKKIKYDRNGIISTIPKDENMEHDINYVLHLNGLIDESDGRTIADTSFSLVKGRKEIYDYYVRFIKGLAKRGKLNKAVLQNKIRELESSETYESYVGVWLFFLKRKIREYY